jgi:hypothetical protein
VSETLVDFKELTPWRPVPEDFLIFLNRFPKITTADRLICVALATSFVKNPFPSAPMIAKVTGIDHKTVIRRLKFLREFGIVGGDSFVKGGIWKIRETNLLPLLRLMSSSRKDKNEEVALESDPQITDTVIPESNNVSAGDSKTWSEIVSDNQKSLMELETSADLDAGATLSGFFQPTSIDSLYAVQTGSEKPKSKRINKATVLDFLALDEKERSKLYETAMGRSIGICYPLWGKLDTFEAYGLIIEEEYKIPSSSHVEVWERVESKFKIYLRSKGEEMCFSWESERASMESSFERYVRHCDETHVDTVSLIEFRRRYYRNNEFWEFRE